MDKRVRPFFVILFCNSLIILLLNLSATYSPSNESLSFLLQGIAILTSMNVAIFLRLKRNRKPSFIGPRNTKLNGNLAVFEPVQIVNPGDFILGNLSLDVNHPGIAIDFLPLDSQAPEDQVSFFPNSLLPNSFTPPFKIFVKILNERLLHDKTLQFYLILKYYFATSPENHQTLAIQLSILIT